MLQFMGLQRVGHDSKVKNEDYKGRKRKPKAARTPKKLAADFW